MPKYIVIDGLDGSGKGDVLKAVGEAFPNSVLTQTREPGGTPLAEEIRKIVLSEKMDPYSEMCLFLAARKETRNMVQEVLDQGLHVVSDRSDSSTFAFQIRGRQKESLEDYFWFMSTAMAPFPSLYILLDLPAEVAQGRLKNRGDAGGEISKFDTEALDFHNRVRKGFHEFSDLCGLPCRFVDASRSREEVAEEVLRIISEHIEE